MTKPEDIAQIVESATAIMRAKGIRRLKIGDLEIDLADEEAQPPAEPTSERDSGAPEQFSDLYEDPDLYGGRVPSLRRKE